MQSTEQLPEQQANKLKDELRDRVIAIVEQQRRRGRTEGARIGAAGVLFLFAIIGIGMGLWILPNDADLDA
jgi:hypothetical protein